ncbi:MAG: hypothetical protein J6A28_01840 [Clostridia bacterium]|nr:hypothetical protein [Clostridia bacterium]
MYKDKLTIKDKREFAAIISGLDLREKRFEKIDGNFYNFECSFIFGDFFCTYTKNGQKAEITCSSKQYGQWMYKIIEKKEGKLAAEEYRKKYNQYWQGHKKEVVEHIRRCAESEVEKLNQQYNDEYFMA